MVIAKKVCMDQTMVEIRVKGYRKHLVATTIVVSNVGFWRNTQIPIEDDSNIEEKKQKPIV